MHQNRPSEPDSPEELSDELNAFARQLRTGFQPSPATLDRGQLMFEAGRTAARAEIGCRETPATRSPSVRILRLWQTAATFMTAVSLVLATTLTLRTAPEPRVVIVERLSRPAAPPDSSQTTDAAQLAQERQPAHIPRENNRSATRTFAPSDDLSEFLVTGSVGSFMQRAHELVFVPSPDSQRSATGIPSVNADSPSRRLPMEPPLSPLSLMGHKAHLSIDRLLEEHPL